MGHHEHQFRVHIERRLRRRTLPIAFVRRNAKARRILSRRCQQRNVAALRRLFCERESDLHVIRDGLAVRRVVQIDHHVPSGGNEFRGAVDTVVIGNHSGQVAILQTIASCQKVCSSAECRPRGWNSGSFIIALLRRPHRIEVFCVGSVRLEGHTHVMCNSRMFGTNLDGGYPCVFGESGRDREPHPFNHIVFRLSGNLERRSLNNNVGPDHPAFGRPLDGRRRILCISFQSPSFNPFDDRVDVVLLQRPVVGEMAVLRIRKPRGHLPRCNRRLHRLGPRPRLFIAQ